MLYGGINLRNGLRLAVAATLLSSCTLSERPDLDVYVCLAPGDINATSLLPFENIARRYNFIIAEDGEVAQQLAKRSDSPAENIPTGVPISFTVRTQSDEYVLTGGNFINQGNVLHLSFFTFSDNVTNVKFRQDVINHLNTFTGSVHVREKDEGYFPECNDQ